MVRNHGMTINEKQSTSALVLSWHWLQLWPPGLNLGNWLENSLYSINKVGMSRTLKGSLLKSWRWQKSPDLFQTNNSTNAQG